MASSEALTMPESTELTMVMVSRALPAAPLPGPDGDDNPRTTHHVRNGSTGRTVTRCYGRYLASMRQLHI